MGRNYKGVTIRNDGHADYFDYGDQVNRPPAGISPQHSWLLDMWESLSVHTEPNGHGWGGRRTGPGGTRTSHSFFRLTDIY